MPSSPSSNFTSYGQWLEVNEDELAASQRRAEEEYAQADMEAQGALGQAELEANNRASYTGGAEADVTKTARYSDYVQLRDKASAAYAQLKARTTPTGNMGGNEAAWREAQAPIQRANDYRAAEGMAKGRVAGVAVGVKAGVDDYNKRLEAQRQRSAVDTEWRESKRAMESAQQVVRGDTQARGEAMARQGEALNTAATRHQAADDAFRKFYGVK